MSKEKLFYTIGEVAEELHLEQHVLRFWESQFSQIKPIKCKERGRRLYDHKCIETIKKIKYMLYDKGYKIEGAKKELKDNIKVNNDKELKDDVKVSKDKEYLKNLLQEMTDLRDYLTSKINNEESSEQL